MGTFLPTLRGQAGMRARATESKSVAFSRYYNDLSARGLDLRTGRRWSAEQAVVEGYERVIWCFKSVNVLATDSSGLPFQLRQGDDVVDDHPLYRVLNKRANKLETGQVFRKRLSAQISLSPRGAFVQRIKSRGGTPREMHLLPPDRMEIIPDGTGGVDHWRLTRRDGSIKNLEPDEVLWFRDPHPDDPYMGVTPLQAARMSVELDHFARLYNVAFMQNDGRPGGILAVRNTAGDSGAKDVDPVQMDRIEKRFGKGPVEAGKLSVIAGELSYVDLATRPRDMQYGQTSANAKMEILAAFGMSEVVLGNASNRTFDNADAEMYNYWTRTIPAHNRIILDGFDEDSDDDLVGFFDTSEIEVLERAARAKRDEARTEVAAGLRSLKSYADLAGYGAEVEDNVYTRSLYLPNGKTPVPTKAGDSALLGLDEAAPAAGAPGAPAALPGGAPGVDMAALNVTAPDGAPDAASAADVGVDMAALAAPPGAAGLKTLRMLQGGGAGPKAGVAFSLSRKAAKWESHEPDMEAQQRLEDDLTVALTALGERWIERTLARVQRPQNRKGTRHWTPEHPGDTRGGTKALDAAKAVDEETWQSEAEDSVSPIVTAAAVAAAVAILTDLDVTPPVGETLREMATRATRGIVRDVVQMIGRSAARQATLLIGMVNDADQDGADMGGIRNMIRERGAKVAGWARSVSTTAATGTISGSEDAAADEADLNDVTLEIRREWISKRDEVVRATHRIADGQSRAMREPFVVGSSLLRFPCDPLAPIHEVANCRCRLRYRHRRTGRFISIPDSLVLSGT